MVVWPVPYRFIGRVRTRSGRSQGHQLRVANSRREGKCLGYVRRQLFKMNTLDVENNSYMTNG